jgi:glycosidase
MGSKDDFLELLDRAHQNQIKVILDFVPNHCSDEHPFFRDAHANPHSPYHDFFVWKEWPEYACFYNVKSMPKLDLSYGSPARAYLLECAQYWLALGVDGFRLDHAHGPEQDFWVDFRRACYKQNLTTGHLLKSINLLMFKPLLQAVQAAAWIFCCARPYGLPSLKKFGL